MQKILTSVANGLVKSKTTSFLRVTSVRLTTLVSLILATIILAACGGGSSGGSSGASSPPTISGLDWSVAGGAILLDWNDFPGASNYTISRNSSSTGGDSLAATIISDSNYTDIGVPFGNAYKYQISTCDSLGCSINASLTVNYFNPAAPSNFKATVNVRSIDLTWAASSYADSYNINRSGEVLAEARTTNSYIDRDVVVGETYSYNVTACNRVSCSSTVNATANYSVPAMPSGISASALNRVISLNWNNVSNTESYTISRNGTIPLNLITITDSNWTDGGAGSSVVINNAYEYQIAACNALGCSSVQTFTVNYYPLSLSNVTNVNDGDDPAYEIFSPRSVAIAEVGGSSYLSVTGFDSNGFSVFGVAADGSLTNVANVDNSDNPAYELDGPISVAIAEIEGSSYLFVAGIFDNGVSVFSVAANGSLANVANVDDSDNPAYELDDPTSVAVAEVGGSSYLFVAGSVDDGVSVFRVAANGSLANVANVEDDDVFNLNDPQSVAVAEVGGSSYLFVAGFDDSGFSVFGVGDDGSLTNVANVDDGDDPAYEFEGARSVAIAKVGGSSYLFVVGQVDSGVSVFGVAADGSLTNVANVKDDGILNLDSPRSVAVAGIGGSSYLFVAGTKDDGVSVFSVAADGSLTNVANVEDDDVLNLDSPQSVAVAEVGGSSYLFVAGVQDNGVSVFKLMQQ